MSPFKSCQVPKSKHKILLGRKPFSETESKTQKIDFAAVEITIFLERKSNQNDLNYPQVSVDNNAAVVRFCLLTME